MDVFIGSSKIARLKTFELLPFSPNAETILSHQFELRNQNLVACRL